MLGACASAVPRADFYETDSASLHRFQAMEVVSSDEAEGLTSIGEVEGLYCEVSDKGSPANNCMGTVICRAPVYERPHQSSTG